MSNSKNVTPSTQSHLSEDSNINLSVKEKLAYGSGNFSYSIVWLPILSFLNFFWTDVCMIPAATAGIFLTVTKLWDAFNDPFIASLEDRTNTKMGRYRPWLWCWIGIIVFFVLTFTNLEGASQLVRNIWCFGTYFLLIVFYTAYEMAHVSLMSVMTTNFDCRNKLAAYRMTFSNVSGIFLTSIFMWLVAKFSTTSTSTGYTVACVIIAIVSIPFFLWSFFGTKERVRPDTAPSIGFIASVKLVLKCKPALILCAAHASWGICGGVLSAVRQYYWIYNVGDENGFSIAMTSWLVGMAVGSWGANWFLGAFKNKRTSCMIVWLINGCLLLVMFFCDFVAISKFLYYVLWFLEGGLGMLGFTGIYSMVADVVEYEQNRNGSRSSAVIFSIVNFACKAGQAIIIGIFNMLMSAFGYIAGATQNGSVLSLFYNGMHLIPAIFFFIGALSYYFYKLDKSSHENALHNLST